MTLGLVVEDVPKISTRAWFREDVPDISGHINKIFPSEMATKGQDLGVQDVNFSSFLRDFQSSICSATSSGNDL